MDLKIYFPNEHIEETIYAMQLENFESKDTKELAWKLKKPIYGLKKASHQWYTKIYQVVTYMALR